MTTNRPKSPRLVAGLMIVICAMLLIPLASAETISSLPYSDSKFLQHFDYYESRLDMRDQGGNAECGLQLHFAQVQNYQNVHYAALEVSRDLNIEEGSYLEAWYRRPSDDSYQPAVLQVRKTRSIFGIVTKTVIYAYVTNWDVGTKTGAWSTYLYEDDDGSPSSTPYLYTTARTYPIQSFTKISGNDDYRAYLGISRTTSYSFSQNSYVEGYINNRYLLSLTEEGLSYNVDLTRYIEGTYFYSILSLYDKANNLIMTDAGSDNVDFMIGANSLGSVTVTTSNTVNTYNISISTAPDEPTNNTVNVYVQNSQTGALLANSHLSILAAAGGTEVEIINATLPGGTGTYTLRPTGGGLPNPDYYRAVATVPGYTQIVENHSFTLNGPHDVIIEMRPDTGGPTDPERCYLEFYVRDLNANPIPSASVQCDNRILQTNSAGYAVFEVAKNASHPWIAKKSGYVTIEGTATTGPNPRYVVNVVLGPGTVPTYTPGPGETPTSTPTPTPTGWGPGQWTPDPDESLGDNARGAAKQTLLEGLQAGQLLFTLCILVLIMAVLDSRRR